MIDFSLLKKSAEENSCINVNFDVPNIVKGSPEEAKATQVFEDHCVKAPRNQFDKYNFLLDISKSEEELLENMHSKHRYNIKLAQKSKVGVREGTTREDFEMFYSLYKDTAERQKYYIHPKTYYQKMWDILHSEGMAYLLVARFNGEPLASWMLFVYDGVLYYPYGGSSEKHKNLMASNLIGWEAIRFGKEKGCRTYDMWGGCKDLSDRSDPYWGFSNFKAKFGGTPVEYLDSYDFVVNQSVYQVFNFANNVRWKLLGLLK